jgi:hypothetical protein
VNATREYIRTAAALAAALALLYTVAPAPEATAIPAFARKYGLSCNTCHAPVPRLKAYGDEFAANGFQLPPGQEPARAFRDVGDSSLLLQRELPVAVRFEGFFNLGLGDSDYNDFQTPWGAKLLSGGQVAKDVSYYFYFFMFEDGEVTGIEDAYLHFNNLGSSPLDVLVGQFQICDPLMKRELRLTYEDYLIYKIRPGLSTANLTYDRGLMVTYDTPFGLGLIGQVVNGNGKPAAVDGLFDVDREKGYGLRGFYPLGPVTLGGFYYSMKERLTPDAPDLPFTNEVTYLGPDLRFSLMDGRLNFTGQYLQRTDTNPAPGELDVTTEGMVGELIFLPQGEDGRIALIGLYNRITSDEAALDYETATASVSYLLHRNLRLTGEVMRDLQFKSTRLVLGFVSAF